MLSTLLNQIKPNGLTVWAEKHAQYIRFLLQTSQEGNECTTT